MQGRQGPTVESSSKTGHFVESNTGNRIRFVGVNLTSVSLFPTHAEAEQLAAHLAKMGVNVVRVHQEDNDNSPLWDASVPGHQTFSADGLDRLDYLLYQLERHGIYLNLNLHVNREFTTADGFPDAVLHLSRTYDKQIDNFEPHMVDLQKQFAKAYLTHINPYSKHSYAEDPAVAFVEINNENALVGWEVPNALNYFNDLPEPYRGEFVGMWNRWLGRKYHTTAALNKAWSPPIKSVADLPPGTNVILESAAWHLEDGVGGATLSSTPPVQPYVAPDITCVNTKSAQPPWKIQAELCRPQPDRRPDIHGEVSYQSRQRSRDSVLLRTFDQPDWHHIGLDDTLHATTDWKDYDASFLCTKPVGGFNRLSLVLGATTGTVWISGLTVRTGGSADPVPASQSLEAGTVDLPHQLTPLARQDWYQFLIDTERAYSDQMRTYLKVNLQVHANMIDTQMHYGGIESLVREQGSDYADDHAYWQHPQFIGKDWGPDWTIGTTPMQSADLASGGGRDISLTSPRTGLLGSRLQFPSTTNRRQTTIKQRCSRY